MIKRLLLYTCLAVVCAVPVRAETTGSVSAYLYIPPHDDNYLQPTGRVDIDRFHFEARYNYEAKHAISFWGGYIFTRKGTIELAFTPMVGYVAGDVRAVAPGGELWLGLHPFEFYTENEYMQDLDESSGSFFYSWSELTATLPMQWRVGGALQRTQAHETPREFQGGALVGTTLGRVQVTAHVFDLDLDDQTWVLSAALSF
ncbi:MAG TPA: hypothetical protein VJS69_05665 [Candidatus Krumholzibacteria bacterium]|nr:hypothetical protein [Candidatus Krumholzibacteria bacterium]